jgi:uncharacterized protein
MRKPFILFTIITLLQVNSNVLQAQTSDAREGLKPGSLAEQQFFLAVRQNALDAVRSRLQGQAQLNALDTMPPNNSALHWAVWDNASDVLGLLIGQPSIVLDRLNGVNETPLMIAALKGNLAMAKQLLDAGAYPNKEGWTPLHYAATEGHVEMIKLLLDAHAYIDAESPNKTTPLMMAARSKNILAVKLLLDEGAELDLVNDQGWSAITFADKAGAKDILEGLQSRAAKLKAREAKPVGSP